MFKYEKEQKICDIGGLKVGGQLGETPPLLIGNMFQKGDRLIESRKKRKFNRTEAERRIRELETASEETGLPGMVAMVANSEDEIKAYIDFFIGVTDIPFAIDIWMLKTRLAAARYIAEMGIQDRVLYNSITPWDEDIEGQVSEMKELGIQHIVLQAFDMEDKGSSGRIKSLKKLLPLVEQGGFKSILVDTAVMNLPATAFSLKANHLVKEKFGLPAGCAPANGTYMWRKSVDNANRARFQAIDAGVQAISALASDFIVYGPMTGTDRIFSAVSAACSMAGALAFEEYGALPAEDHPLKLLFPDISAEFEKAKGEH
ncbi:tetrahydromethanopterin S-methyltransferase subunit H [Thermodesulfobacteriota bacterium]